MSRRVIGLLLSSLLLACGGDDDAVVPDDDAGVVTATPHARIAWRVRCGGATGCTDDAPARIVDADDGEAGHSVECDVTPMADGNRRFVVTIGTPEGAAMRVRGATIAADGDRIIGSNCRLEVDEPDDFDLEGACSSNPPSADRPCQIQRIDITAERAVTAEIRCTDVPAAGNPGVTRDVTDDDVVAAVAELELTGCAGL
ncbi:hypothetical protein [Sandaracinus amylolyticus]|uniref:hypothetical protein n=1 Tax=Sandaracinus amylolyticus TaxID=927083 RepID=UPI001F3080CE|nr:hypothetical protein [Sandaracinus amylolyticus]UJR79194.1 Hypothetical protein I5071_12270 [Sandaracinus amylolyticus]